MHIALDATPLTVPTGGVSRYTSELALALAECFPDDEFWLLSDQLFPFPESTFPNLRRDKRPLSTLDRRWWLWGLQAAISRLTIDVFHGTDFAVPYVPIRPSLLTLHDLSPWLDPAWHSSADRVRSRTPLLLRLGLATLVLTPSEAVRRAAIDRFRLTPDRIVSVPHAASARFYPAESAPPITPYLLYVGTLEPRKNLALLISAWREVRTRIPVDLVLAGRRREDFPQLAPEPGLQVLGEVPDERLPELYSGCAACVYPSLYEGFGLPVLEAMQCGAAVIASNDPAIVETAGDAAVTLDVNRPTLWVEAIEGVLRNPEWRCELRRRSTQRAGLFPGAEQRGGRGRFMPKLSGDSGKPDALLLSPEAPFPAVGGGALRTASIFQYLAERYALDVVTFRQPDAPDPLEAFPRGKARRVHVIDLPRHGRSNAARAIRNLRRAVRGKPPLLDRFSGFEAAIGAALQGRRYSVGVVEHFWCAPYATLLKPLCGRLVLDLHNIESQWHATLARSEPLAARLPHALFAAAYRRYERELLPLFDTVLVTSSADARRAGRPCVVYPNALPYIRRPSKMERDTIIFTGNLEYAPNLAALSYFRDRIWPTLKQAWPGLIWEIAGKNPNAVRDLVAGDPRVHLLGPMDDAVTLIASAKLAIVPLRSGSGTRIKILEAWAAATAVVSTTIGAEGLECEPGRDLLIADSPSDFSCTVTRLLRNADERKRIGDAGRALYESHYTWARAWSVLDETLAAQGAS